MYDWGVVAVMAYGLVWGLYIGKKIIIEPYCKKRNGEEYHFHKIAIVLLILGIILIIFILLFIGILGYWRT